MPDPIPAPIDDQLAAHRATIRALTSERDVMAAELREAEALIRHLMDELTRLRAGAETTRPSPRLLPTPLTARAPADDPSRPEPDPFSTWPAPNGKRP